MPAEKKFASAKKFVLMPWNFMTTSLTDMDKYRYLAEQAAKVGVTHLGAGGLGEKSRWEQEDPTDPYANWTMVSNSLFKCVPPPELGDAVPRAFAERNMGIIMQRCAILRKHNLRGYFRGNEPFYVREEVFEKHPVWRGPRVDHPRRSKKELFALCTDNPEVLQLYRRAMADFARKAPQVDIFSLKPNDEGSGFCWSGELYNSPNGPAWCRERRMGDRVAGFYSALRDGARDAGVEVDVFPEYNFPPAEAEAVRAALGKIGLAPSTIGAGMECSYPIVGVPFACAFVESLAHLSYGQKTDILMMRFDGTADYPALDLYFDILAQFSKNPARTLTERLLFLRQVAVAQVGEKCADALLDMWESIARCYETFQPLGLFGMLLSERWLTRPLVPFPLELPPEDRDYYRKHQFQAMSEEEAADLRVSQGGRILEGHLHWETLARVQRIAMGRLNAAIAAAAQVANDVENEKKAAYYRLLGKRLCALRCLLRTCEYAPEFQVLLLEGQKKGPPLEVPARELGDNNRRMIYNCMHAEMANIHELIAILKDDLGAIMTVAGDSSCEDAFTFGPDLVDQLQRKVRIMRDHWLDLNRVFSRPNV
jgi:hypothetical protein